MFVFVSVIRSRGLLRHFEHDLIYIKISKMAAFFPISLVHIVGLRGISLSLFLPNHQMVNTRNNQCNGQPSNNNNNHNNANLEQLLTTQNQLMQAMLQILNNMQPNQQQAPPPVSFGGVPANSPRHLLTSQRPHGRRRLAQGG
jgi:hypothetical protein